MPSSVGHALGAVAAGWSAGAAPAVRQRAVVQVLLLAFLGMAPDLDLLIGRHRAETHSLGAVVLVALVAAWWRWPLGRSRVRIGLVAAAAWGSHVLLDLLGTDRSVPVGVMAFWPLSDRYVQLAAFFPPVERRWWEPFFVSANLHAVTVELLVLGPAIASAYWWRRSRRRSHE